MAEKGWIKLHRKVLDCWVWQIKPYDKARAWVDLLLLTMHHDKKMVVEEKPITIERGSYFISRGKLADRWGWSIKKVDAYLNTLENEKMVTTNRTRKGTIITIVNYEEYQIEGTTQDTTEDTPQEIAEDIPQGTPHGTSQGTQNKNNKELKNNKNKLLVSEDTNCQTEAVRRVVEEWNTLSEYGIKPVSRLTNGTKRYDSLVARIKQYSVDDVLKAIDNIRNSDFLQGKHGGKPWQVTFDWFVLPNNFPKVLEGNYNNETPTTNNNGFDLERWLNE